MSISVADAAAWISECARVFAANRNYLTALDAAIGDADHGVNMDRGFAAAVERLPEAAATGDVGALFRVVGMTLLLPSLWLLFRIFKARNPAAMVDHSSPP